MNQPQPVEQETKPEKATEQLRELIANQSAMMKTMHENQNTLSTELKNMKETVSHIGNKNKSTSGILKNSETSQAQNSVTFQTPSKSPTPSRSPSSRSMSGTPLKNPFKFENAPPGKVPEVTHQISVKAAMKMVPEDMRKEAGFALHGKTCSWQKCKDEMTKLGKD